MVDAADACESNVEGDGGFNGHLRGYVGFDVCYTRESHARRYGEGLNFGAIQQQWKSLLVQDVGGTKLGKT